MLIRSATIFGAPIGEDTEHRKLVFLVERQHPIIEHISRCDRCFSRVELRMSDLAIHTYKRLLVDTTNAFECSHIISILRAKVARMLRFDLTTSLIVILFRSIAATWSSVRIIPSAATFHARSETVHEKPAFRGRMGTENAMSNSNRYLKTLGQKKTL